MTAYRGLSESQANADALARRAAPYAPEHDVSKRLQWDYRRREPADLREAVRLVRQAYADEVPGKLHEGPDAIGEGGTPKMTTRAEGYLFGSPHADDSVRRCNCAAPKQHMDDCPRHPRNAPILTYYQAPFRAHLDTWQHGAPTTQRWARIIAHITIGSQGPHEAAVAEGAHPHDAKDVAERALRAFLRSLSDVKVTNHVVPETDVA